MIKELTETQRKALTYIKEHPTASYSEISKHLWPTSNNKNKNAAWLFAGAYCAMLRDAGLIYDKSHAHIELTDLAKKLLAVDSKS